MDGGWKRLCQNKLTLVVKNNINDDLVISCCLSLLVGYWRRDAAFRGLFNGCKYWPSPCCVYINILLFLSLFYMDFFYFIFLRKETNKWIHKKDWGKNRALSWISPFFLLSDFLVKMWRDFFLIAQDIKRVTTESNKTAILSQKMLCFFCKIFYFFCSINFVKNSPIPTTEILLLAAKLGIVALSLKKQMWSKFFRNVDYLQQHRDEWRQTNKSRRKMRINIIFWFLVFFSRFFLHLFLFCFFTMKCSDLKGRKTSCEKSFF